ncbi:MAG: Demethylphylloquinone reductase NdbB [Chlamydiae bacterium]|nr:Demethylphylloquinone reductase NdbB [Chlamydiota bacterium]
MAYPKVIIIGGGFGGLNAAKTLKRGKLDLLIIDKTNHHLFQPLLYQVATAALSPGEIATPIREIFRDQANTAVIMGEVVSIEKKEKMITLRNGDRLSYDYLILAPGTRHSYFGHDQWEPLAPGLKTIQDALKIREQVLMSFEKAERLDHDTEVEKYLNFVIVGGGPTGVEMAGAIAEIAHKTMFKNFRKIRPERSKIYLIEALPNILTAYPESLGLRAQKDLTKMGVRVLTNKKVTNISKEGVQIEDQFIPSVNVIWAAGNQAPAFLKTLDVPQDRAGHVMVKPDLSIPEHPEIFVIGDAAHTKGKDGNPLPGIATTAIQQGSYVAKVIRKEIPKENRRPFKFLDKGSMATIGTKKAVAVMGKLKLTGFLAWCAWCFIHIIYLIGFRNRFGVMVEWFYYFMTSQRGIRLIYRSIEKGLPSQQDE